MEPEFRKLAIYDEEGFVAGLMPVAAAWRALPITAGIVPRHVRRSADDLSSESHGNSAGHSEMAINRVGPVAGNGHAIETFGKVAAIGRSRSLENEVRPLHTLRPSNFHDDAEGAGGHYQRAPRANHTNHWEKNGRERCRPPTAQSDRCNFRSGRDMQEWHQCSAGRSDWWVRAESDRRSLSGQDGSGP